MRTFVPLFCLALAGAVGLSAPCVAAANADSAKLHTTKKKLKAKVKPKAVLTAAKSKTKSKGGKLKGSAVAASAPAAKALPAAKPAEPAGPDPAVVSLERFGLSIQRATLDNGLKVVMNPDHAAPTVAVSVTYGVGSSSEVVGKTGFAHLFEH
ncbi:MAG TPA: hypothetical protein VIK01_09855, partial [Polyangiaceae bacterium]